MAPHRTLPALVAIAVASAATAVALTPVSAVAAPPTPTTVTFNHTGAAQTWTVPADVTRATFDLYGAEGAGENNGGRGGRTTATVRVTPGDVVTVLVGGAGLHVRFGDPLGFNGGGNGHHGGGGATDVRIGGTDLDDRVLVAGGGGGSGSYCDGTLNKGGAGGNPGSAGDPTKPSCTGAPGGGGTSTAGGVNPDNAGLNGSLGQGGGLPEGQYISGGGGGWYGGAGANSAGAGGGSSHGPDGTVFETGVRTGHGVATVTFVESRELTVTRSGTGTGSVTSSPDGIDCGTTCADSFELGSDVTLDAAPGASSTFTGWSGACTGAGTCTVTMDQARAVTATFAEVPAPQPQPEPTPPPAVTAVPPPAVTTVPPPARDRMPVLRDLEVKPGQMLRGRASATLHFKVSEAVSLSVRLRQMCGEKVCGRYHQVPAKALEGRNSYRLRGALKPTRLVPGRYRVTLVAKDSAGQRDRKRVHFKIRH